MIAGFFTGHKGGSLFTGVRGVPLTGADQFWHAVNIAAIAADLGAISEVASLASASSRLGTALSVGQSLYNAYEAFEEGAYGWATAEPALSLGAYHGGHGHVAKTGHLGQRDPHLIILVGHLRTALNKTVGEENRGFTIAVVRYRQSDRVRYRAAFNRHIFLEKFHKNLSKLMKKCEYKQIPKLVDRISYHPNPRYRAGRGLHSEQRLLRSKDYIFEAVGAMRAVCEMCQGELQLYRVLPAGSTRALGFVRINRFFAHSGEAFGLTASEMRELKDRERTMPRGTPPH